MVVNLGQLQDLDTLRGRLPDIDQAPIVRDPELLGNPLTIQKQRVTRTIVAQHAEVIPAPLEEPIQQLPTIGIIYLQDLVKPT